MTQKEMILDHNILIADICSNFIKSNIITIRYYCSSILTRISPYKEGVDGVIYLFFNNPKFLPDVVETLKTFLPSEPTNTKETEIYITTHKAFIEIKS